MLRSATERGTYLNVRQEEVAMSEEPMPQSTPQYISMEDAAHELNVNRSTVYYYLGQLGITPRKFPLDRRAYIALADLKLIKDAKQAASERRH
jgi:hypothetical protein